jgi:hypothetical protein
MKLSDLKPAKGYNLAAVVPNGDGRLAAAAARKEVAPLLAILAERGLPVLAEAKGPLGVLRALEIRSSGIMESIALSKRDHLIIHLVFDGPSAAINFHVVKLHREVA